MAQDSRLRMADGVAVLALALAAIAFFWKLALTDRILAGVDAFAYFTPYRELTSEALKSGRLPLWNPHLFMGAPLLANSQAAVLYPLNWPFVWLSAPRQLAWNIVLHVWLAGAGAYLWARSALAWPRPSAWAAAAAFAFGGFVGAQVEHVNQLDASAWLPWLLLCQAAAGDQGKRRPLAFLAGSAVVALTLLAGHTQAAYIVLAAAAGYAVSRGLTRLPEWTGRRKLLAFGDLGLLAAMVVLGAVLAAGQMLPTWELSRLSVRQGGLAYRDAASFSLRPDVLPEALLPPHWGDPPLSEFVAYVGLAGLALAALGAWGMLRRAWRWLPPSGQAARGRQQALLGVGFAVLGIFLALGAYNPVYYLLYRIVPGFSMFRVPARWLLLYAFGMALLAGLGVRVLSRYRRWGWVAIGLVLAELFLAGRKLPYDHPTAAIAYESMRSAPAHLLSHQESGPFRFLSMSDITYDPGDLDDLRQTFAGYLHRDELYSLVVATKMKEVLGYNLPALSGLDSVDGYDGGLLPTARYVTLEELFLSADEIWPDGRLRQQLRSIPPARLLGLLNVRYVITDKQRDAWVGGVYYDLQHDAPLGQVSLTDVPPFAATHLGIVWHLSQGAYVPPDTGLAAIVLQDRDGDAVTRTLLAGGGSTGGSPQGAGAAAGQPAATPVPAASVENGYSVSLVDLGEVVEAYGIHVRSLLPESAGSTLVLNGLSLIDVRAGASRSISIDPHYRQVHSGDVKIYENLSVQPRAFVVHRSRVLDDDVATLAALKDPAFDPAAEVILNSGVALALDTEPPAVRIERYEAGSIQMRARLQAPGYLVLTDAFYPGWEVLVDGRGAPLLRADLYFRAVPLGPGYHTVEMRFQPASVRIGLRVGLAAWIVAVAAAFVLAVRAGLRRRHEVQ